MAVVMNMTWNGVTPEQYDEVRDLVGWETDPPVGGVFHVAWFEGGALHVFDVWDAPESFQAFTETRLMPGVAKLGIEGEPQVSFAPAHRIWDVKHGEASS